MDPNTTLAELRELLTASYSDAIDDERTDNALDRLDAIAERARALDEWLSKGGFLPYAWERKIDVIHTRDPDSECGLMVYVNGVRVEFKQWSFDPGAGYEMDEFEENKREDMEAAPGYLKPILEKIYDEMEPTYRRWSL